MIRTTHAQHLAPVAIAARPCGLGFGYQWRLAAMSMAVVSTTNGNAMKRPSRRLGLAAT